MFILDLYCYFKVFLRQWECTTTIAVVLIGDLLFRLAGLCYYFTSTVIEQVLWSGWLRKQNIATKHISLCLHLFQLGVSWASLLFFCFFSYTLFLMHFFPPVLLSSSQAFLHPFPEIINHLSHSELKGYISNADMITWLLPEVIVQIVEMLEVQGENQNTLLMIQEFFFTGDGRNSTVLLFLETCRWNNMNAYLFSQIFPQECSEKQNIQQSTIELSRVHTCLRNWFQIAVGEVMGAFNALWFPFLKRLGHKDTKVFVFLKREKGEEDLWKRQT